MRYIDEYNNTITAPDLERGQLVPDKILVTHHDAIEPRAGKWHYETLREYANGGKDIARVWDEPPVPGADAWDEFEDVMRYVPYSPEEMAVMEAERSKPTPPTLEELAAENERLAALLEYVAMMADIDIEEVE